MNNSNRKMTRFLCQEMLYDYAMGQLDEGRNKAIAEFVQNDEEIRQQFEDIKYSLDYCAQLSATKISEPFFIEIKENKSSFYRFIEGLSWKNWPEYMKWSAEALAVSCIVAIVAVTVPWDQLAEMVPENTNYSFTEVQNTPVQQDQSDSAIIKNIENEVEGDFEQGAPLDKSKADGVVYRAFMHLENINKVTPEIISQIERFGGTKAGRVQLGWRKKGGSYFHFKLQESNYKPLVQSLNKLGNIRVYKDPHWQVMPEGVVRIILWVEDASDKGL